MMHPEARCQATRLFAALEYGEQPVTDPANSGRVQALAADYRQQVRAIISEMSDVFASLDEDPGEYPGEYYGKYPGKYPGKYHSNLLDSLPDWIRGPCA